MKNSNDTIGNRTRDLPACSAVPQPNKTILKTALSSSLYPRNALCQLWKQKRIYVFFKKVGGAVGVCMEPRGRWTEKVWEPLLYGVSPPHLLPPPT